MLPSATGLLTRLVALPSVSSTVSSLDMSNEPVIDALAGWLSDLGFHCEKQAVGIGGKYNLIATLGSGEGGLVLAGHTDTVPFDEALWQQDPFELTRNDDRLSGLGATDMKGFFAVALQAASAFRAGDLKQPLILIATADEESTMDGARNLLEEGRPRARYAVIGEPTDLQPVHMHKGIMMEAITVRGRSGHSSNPALGKNALEVMHRVISELMALRQEWQQRYRNPAFAVPEPTLNLGCIHGGDNPNRICGECELHFDIRLMPDMNIEELRQIISQRLAIIAAEADIDIGLRALMPGADPFAEPADSTLLGALESLTGAKRRSVAFATEAPFFQALGMETVVMGPGSIDCAHQPGEFIPIAQMEHSIEILKGLIHQLCVRSVGE